MVTYTELAILRTRWTAEKALNHPALTWVDGVPYHNGRRLILQGEDKAALIEPVYQQCDPRLSVEGLYDEVNRHYVNITKRDIKTYLYTTHPENRRAPYRIRPCSCCRRHEHGERAYQQHHTHRKASV
jgi:hypothetical protein